jgi:hypothetical protein
MSTNIDFSRRINKEGITSPILEKQKGFKERGTRS